LKAKNSFEDTLPLLDLSFDILKLDTDSVVVDIDPELDCLELVPKLG